MVYGPCGGVHADGSCEVDEHRCPFVDRPLVQWAGVSKASATEFDEVAGAMSRVLIDFRVAPIDCGSIREVAAVFRAGAQSHVLLGHHGGATVNFPPSFLARAALDEGLHPWVTVACRDRDRLALSSELAALSALGVAGVHCVTGDAHGPTVPDDISPVFDLDALGLVALARASGLTSSVAANPLAPPTDLRPRRLAEKVRAGAHACIVNHTASIDVVAAFVADARAAGADVPFVVCVPVITDAFTVDVLRRFPGVSLDDADTVQVLRADDPVAAGIDHAARRAHAVLEIDGVTGVNLSGPACGGTPVDSARIMVRVAEAVMSA
jgi:5,10-methylenetetrahydrofolate reductase